jgi:alpha-beta hydrolase superfamily lysophospholipase
LRASTKEEWVVGASLAAVALHLVDRALLDTGGAGWLTRLLLLAGAGLTLLVWALYLTGGRVSRTALVGTVGLAASLVGSASSVPHAVLVGIGGSDYTGLLFTAAGIALVVVAFVVALRGRRLALKLLLGVAAVFVIAQWLIGPAINAGVATNAPRPVIAAAGSLGMPGARDVTFPAHDGTRLSGWYIPSRNGAAVILLHGSHGDRTDTLPQLHMLSAAGYGILAYDARGHGRSAGQTNALGWSGANDLAGAVSFLGRQPGVNPRRVAALGLSMGAEVALRAAAAGVPLHGIIADGAGASTLGDNQLVGHGLAPVFVSETWLTMRAIELISGESEPAPLKSIVGYIHIPVLLIASNASSERTIDAAYRARIGSDATLWYVPDAGHTNALQQHPQAYTARVLTFLKTAIPSG